MERSYLLVYGIELRTVVLDERLGPSPDKRDVPQELHKSIGHTLAVSGHKKPDTQNTEGTGQGRQRPQGRTHVMGDEKEHQREQPKPEMTEDMGHGVEDNRRGGPLGAYPRRQLHNAVRLPAHQSARRGIVECKSRYRDLIQPRQGDKTAYVYLRLVDVAGRPPTDTFYYKVPGRSVEDIQADPQKDNSKKPVARMLQALPDLSEVEPRYHQGENNRAKDEECILVFLFHLLVSFVVVFCGAPFGAFCDGRFLGIENLTFSLSSLFSL